MRTPLLLAALLTGTLFACTSTTPEPEPAGPDTRPAGIEEAKSELTRDLAPVVTPADQAALVAGNTDFALALFKQTAKPTTNLVQSPHSISTALAMVYAGAAGQTKADVATALHFDVPDAELHPAFNWLDLQIESRAKSAAGKDGKPARVHVDNLLFGAKQTVFGTPFLDTLAVHYGAGVQKVDFGQPSTVETINSWVAQRTEQRIPKLLDAVDASTRLVLVNTVYVNAAWAAPFTKEATADETFATPSGARTLPFMHQTGGMRYADTDAAQVVELGLSTEGLVFDVILPKGDLAAFEAEQTRASLSSLLGTLPYTEVALSLPKFKIEPTADGSIKQALSALGMASAFTAAADLSPLVPAERIQLFDVVHKTFFEIDEEGLEAAAATAVTGRATSAPPIPVPMRVDRPFLIVLRDLPTGQVLFLGHIVDPGAE